MKSTLLSLAALLLGVALLLLGNGLQITLLPLRAQAEAFDPVEIGLLGSAYFLGFALGGLFGPRLVMRVGHVRAFAAMVAAASALVLAHPLFTEPLIWWMLRVGSGFCFATLYVVTESWLNERADNTTRGAVFAIYSALSMSMLGFGQFLLLLGPIEGFSLFVIASILVSIAALPVALTTAAQPAPIKSVEIRVRRLFALSPVGFVGCLVVGGANGAIYAHAPIFAQDVSPGVSGVALFMGVLIFAGALGQWPLGLLSDRMDRRRVITLTSLGAAGVGLALFFLRTLSADAVFALICVYGFLDYPLYALSVAHVNDMIDSSDFVEAASGLSLIWGAGAVLGPLIGAAAIDIAGRPALFATTAALHVALALFTLYRMTRRAAPAAEERGIFMDAVKVAKTISPIDPISPDPEAEAGPPPAPADGAVKTPD